MDAAIAGLIGGLIGAAASLLGLVVQQYFQTKRERIRVATDLGLAEYKHDLDLAKAAGPSSVAPLAAYVIFNLRLLEELSKGRITPEQVEALSEEKKGLLAAFPGAPEQ